jgi:hypothetical protein
MPSSECVGCHCDLSGWCVRRRLTCDMRGRQRRHRWWRNKQTCAAVGCPLDGMVRRLLEDERHLPCFRSEPTRNSVLLLEAYMILLAENEGVFDSFVLLPPCAGRQRSGTDSPSQPLRRIAIRLASANAPYQQPFALAGGFGNGVCRDWCRLEFDVRRGVT